MKWFNTQHIVRLVPAHMNAIIILIIMKVPAPTYSIKIHKIPSCLHGVMYYDTHKIEECHNNPKKHQ